MRSADRQMGRALRAGFLAAACAFAGNAFAGGALYLVPVGGTLKPAHWVGTVKVYLDKGNLNVGTSCEYDPNTYECILDANGNPVYPVLDQQAGDDLVAHTVAQWSGVPTSSFRAAIAGRSPVDITGANVYDYIGKYNGGGIQTIYDADNSVIMAMTGGDGYGVLGIASPELPVGPGPHADRRGLADHRRLVPQCHEHRPDLGRRDPRVRSRDQPRAHADQRLLREQQPECLVAVRGRPRAGGPRPVRVGGRRLSGGEPGRDHVPHDRSVSRRARPTTAREMAKVHDDADDMAALSSIYPAPGYTATTGTLKGGWWRRTARARSLASTSSRAAWITPLAGAISRISGDSTQGLLGADGNFVMTGLVPGASYVVYIDQLRAGAFSTPRRCCSAPRSTGTPAKAATPRRTTPAPRRRSRSAAGETRQITIAVNGIPRAPTFTHDPVRPAELPSPTTGSDRRHLRRRRTFRRTGCGTRQSFGKTGWRQPTSAGSGVNIALSGNGRVVGGTVDGPRRSTTGYGTHGIRSARRCGPRSAAGRRITNAASESWPGCDIFHTSIYDLSTDGSTAVGLAFQDCHSVNVYAFKWTAKTGMKMLPKIGDGAARANAVSGDGRVVGGWQDFNDQFPYRVGSLWQGNEQTDPARAEERHRLESRRVGSARSWPSTPPATWPSASTPAPS